MNSAVVIVAACAASAGKGKKVVSAIRLPTFHKSKCGSSRFTVIGSVVLSAALVTAPSFAQTENSASATIASIVNSDESLTFHGITLYGTIDLGIQYETHGAPASDYYPTGTEAIIEKNSNKSVFAATSSNMGQSLIGLRGTEDLFDDVSAVFRLETYFNPASGELSDGLKSLTLNNGRALNQQTTNVDTSVAGQAFAGAAYAGFSSPSWGTLTFGRQNGLLADGIAKYDPQLVSQAFSVIGFSGVAAGSGDTEDRRLDSSLKYTVTYDALRAGAQYQFDGGTGGSAWEFQLGGDYAGGSLDGFFVHKKDAISMSSLSTAEVSGLPALGYSSDTSLAGTVSDNTGYGIMGSYSFGAPKVYAGYEHIEYANPSSPLSAGFNDIGGYILAYVDNAAFDIHKDLQVSWVGLKYSVTSSLDVTGAYYRYDQNSYGTGVYAGCSGNQSSACSGTLSAVSVTADYRFSKRFDVYAGAMWSSVMNGLASGYLHTSTINPTLGARFSF